MVRIWRAFALQPHRTETFKLSRDPLFVGKVRDIVGLYMNPPDRALVLCVDEKPSIQALERTAPVLPMRPGQVEPHTHDYVARRGHTLHPRLLAVEGGRRVEGRTMGAAKRISSPLPCAASWPLPVPVASARPPMCLSEDDGETTSWRPSHQSVPSVPPAAAALRALRSACEASAWLEALSRDKRFIERVGRGSNLSGKSLVNLAVPVPMRNVPAARKALVVLLQSLLALEEAAPAVIAAAAAGILGGARKDLVLARNAAIAHLGWLEQVPHIEGCGPRAGILPAVRSRRAIPAGLSAGVARRALQHLGRCPVFLERGLPNERPGATQAAPNPTASRGPVGPRA